jgi:hypothetical protein
MLEAKTGLFLAEFNSLICRTEATVTWSRPATVTWSRPFSVGNRPDWKVIHGNLVRVLTVTWSRPLRIPAADRAVTWSLKPIVRIPISFLPVIADAFLWIAGFQEAFRKETGSYTPYSACGRPGRGGRGGTTPQQPSGSFMSPWASYGHFSRSYPFSVQEPFLNLSGFHHAHSCIGITESPAGDGKLGHGARAKRGVSVRE